MMGNAGNATFPRIDKRTRFWVDLATEVDARSSVANNEGVETVLRFQFSGERQHGFGAVSVSLL